MPRDVFLAANDGKTLVDTETVEKSSPFAITSSRGAYDPVDTTMWSLPSRRRYVDPGNPWAMWSRGRQLTNEPDGDLGLQTAMKNCPWRRDRPGTRPALLSWNQEVKNAVKSVVKAL
jgi:hypothetical protein